MAIHEEVTRKQHRAQTRSLPDRPVCSDVQLQHLFFPHKWRLLWSIKKTHW